MPSAFIVIALLPVEPGHAFPACGCVHGSVRPRGRLVSLDGDTPVLQTQDSLSPSPVHATVASNVAWRCAGSKAARPQLSPAAGIDAQRVKLMDDAQTQTLPAGGHATMAREKANS